MVAGQPAGELRGGGRAGAGARRRVLLASGHLLYHRGAAGLLARPPRPLRASPLPWKALPRALPGLLQHRE